MMQNSEMLGSDLMQRALAELGRRCAEEAEVVIVGGAAALLCHGLTRTTGDIDVVDATPRLVALKSAIQAVANEFGLAQAWINDGAKAFLEVLPSDFRERLVEVGTFGALRVLAISRQDFILMKLYGFRDTDFEDLQMLAPPPTSEEIAFVEAQLMRIAEFDSKKAQLIELYLQSYEPDGPAFP